MDRKLLLLGLLRQQEMHGYQLYEFIERELSFCTDLKKPTAYYLLNKMAERGWIVEEQSQEGKRPPRKVFRLTAQGEAAYQRGDYAAAAREFAKYVENSPQDPRYAVAYYMLGSCYLELDQSDLAEPNLRTAVDLDPTKADYRLALGQYLVKAGEYADADAVFDELDAASVAPQQRSTVALLRAKAALEVGDATKAVTVLEDLYGTEEYKSHLAKVYVARVVKQALANI